MAEFKVLVLSKAQAGREAEYDDWYENAHLNDMLATNGVVAAQRFRTRGDSKWTYGAIYELEGNSPEEIMGEVRRRTETGEFSASDAIDRTALDVVFLEPRSPRRTA